MPEIKHNFTKGRMNKDLDERLVPNGEYKDAVNIQVSTSEGSDVGTAQNILGNSLIAGQGFIPSTANCVGSVADEKNDKLYYFVVDEVQLANTSNISSLVDGITIDSTDKVTFVADGGTSYANPIVTASAMISGTTYIASATISGYNDLLSSGNTIGFSSQGGISPVVGESRLAGDGTIHHEFISNGDAIRIFAGGDIGGVFTNISISEPPICLIVEHDSKTNSITPVVVDTNNTALRFHPNRLVTGINVIDDMLFWTDNHSEPKKINIPRCIKGTDKTGTIHTKLINESRDINIGSNVDLEEKHITVIRKSPRVALSLDMITERNPNFTYSGVMRITADPGGLDTGANHQNASSLWVSDWSSRNHLYDFSELTVGDWFRTNIETDINGDSGFTLDWEVGDTVVFKEFSGDTYSDAPSTPITDYTIKAKILEDNNNNNFTDQVAEIMPNNDLTLPNINGSEPLGYSWSSGDITYDSQDSKIVFNGVGSWQRVSGAPDLPFAYGTGSAAGVYKLKFEVQGMTTGSSVHAKIIADQPTQYPYYWTTQAVTTNGMHEFILTLDTTLASTTSNFWYGAGKLWIRTGSGTSNDFEILNISLERQDVTDAGMKMEVLSINGVPSMVVDGYSELKYAVDLLDEEEKIFESKFPRFAYRYQYEDKEYSTISPFTEVAFLPGSFDYHPQKGYNLGMTNSIKEIIIKGFAPAPGEFQDVIAVDILYKDEASPNVYVVDTIKNNQVGSDIWNNNEYIVKSESIKRALPSNQLLRPWDAVPKKALAQEISGNRVIYGNYTQGFDLLEPGTKQEYYPDFDFSIRSDYLGLNSVKSIKSLREYQLGVVFIDKYGRETPVLSNSSGISRLTKKEAAKSNKMEVSFGNTVFPEDMEYFKFFVKETSGEYYNMTMDRWWDAGDGLAWLSFGSADINKIDIDTFLILKKGLESNDLVTEPAKYKVLAIETEAPDYIKNKKALIEEKKHTFIANSVSDVFSNTIDDAPLLGRDTFKMKYKPFASGPGSELHNTEDGILYVEFANSSVASKRYRVTGLTTDKDQAGVTIPNFSVKLDKAFGEDINFICDDPNDGLNPTKIIDGTLVRFYKYTPENSNEFDGRFFVKVISDGVFIENTTVTSGSVNQYRTTLFRKLYYMGSDQAVLHSEALTGQTLGVYADSAGTDAGGNLYQNLTNFGRFAPFFRNYKYASADGDQMEVKDTAGNLVDTIDVGQYRFDDTTDSEWRGELMHHIANSHFNPPASITPTSLKNADHSGWDNASGDADKRYGTFNNSGEQTRGNVWFIDGGPYTGYRTASEHSLHWDWTGQGNSSNVGINIPNNSTASIKIAMGGIYNPSTATSINHFYDIGTDDSSGGWYSGNKFKDLVGKIKPSVKFRFREDPTGEVYTIKPSGVSYQNLVRWSDGGTRNPGSASPSLSGERPWNLDKTPMLSPNHTRGYHAHFTNDRTGESDVTWEPTNSGVTGAIPGGLKLTAAVSSIQAQVQQGIPPSFVIVATDIHDITCSVNGGKYSITKGMILTSFGGVTLDGTFTDPEGSATSSGFSHEPLIVKDITPIGTGAYNLHMVGYSSPILYNDFTAASLLKHKVWATTPVSGNTLVFQQPAMNGYSQYSVNRINAQDAANQGWSLSSPALLAVGYTIEFLEEIERDVEFPDNPAIWETEPKESVDLDIYYEASGYNPLRLTEDTKNLAIPIRSRITHVQNPLTNLGMTDSTDAGVYAVSYTEVANPVGVWDGDITGWAITIVGVISLVNWVLTFESPLVGGNYINIGDQLLINRPDGSSITVTVKGWNFEADNRAPIIYIEDALHSPDTKYTLSWHNCYSFGNGVESNRIRDTYNLPYIANGVKASTTLNEHPYEESLKYGLIYSGVYNGSIGINSLNQFIAAEKISKDINPTYGSIQKLKAGWGQGGDLITLCEDRVLKILANKDALYNADGNPQLLSTNAVLGQAIPYSGEFGISKNPESFASEAYRAYFTDRVRGSVIRLSADGLTPISSHGMKDWFRDNLKPGINLIGSYDDRQDEYNLTLSNPQSGEGTTVSFKEDVRGWVSFKSFIQENGVSCANSYYTFANGRLWIHHVESLDELTTVSVTGVKYSSGAVYDGKYFFFELEEMDGLLGGSWGSTTIKVKQYRDNSLIREDEVLFYGGGGNSLNPPSDSGGLTKGHGRFAGGSMAGDWQVGDVITIGNIDRNTFYDTFANSSLNVVLNDMPGSIKSYHTLGYEGSQSRVIQNLDDNEYYNLKDKDGWYVSSIETNKDKGSLLEFIEKEGKWFNYIKGLESNVEDLDFGSFEVQGLGIQSEMVGVNTNGFGDGTFRIFIDGGVNSSLQVGDAIYYQPPGSDEVISAGVVVTNPSFYDGITGPTQDLFQVTVADLFSNPPGPSTGAYWMFVKNQVINMSGLSGYYADAMFENNSKVKAELFAVGSEITESSK